MANALPKTKANTEPYRKVKISMWDDTNFRELSPLPPSGQSLFIYLLTGPCTGIIPGLFRAGRAAMAEELGWDIQSFDLALDEAIALGMVKADLKARVFWLPNAARHNPPGSINVVKSWAKAFDYLPECEIKWEAWQALRAACHGVSGAIGKAFDMAMRKPKDKPKDMPCPLPSGIQKAVKDLKDLKDLKPKKHMSGSEKQPNQTSPPGEKKYPEDFEILWREYPKRSGSSCKAGALKNWQARRREGITPETMLDAVCRYRKWCEAEGVIGTKFVRLAQTFLGPGHEFDNPWEINPGGKNYGQNLPATGESAAVRAVREQRERWEREQRESGGLEALGRDGRDLREPLDYEEWVQTVNGLGESGGLYER